jgi:hypothetical protein
MPADPVSMPCLKLRLVTSLGNSGREVRFRKILQVPITGQVNNKPLPCVSGPYLICLRLLGEG